MFPINNLISAGQVRTPAARVLPGTGPASILQPQPGDPETARTESRPRSPSRHPRGEIQSSISDHLASAVPKTYRVPFKPFKYNLSDSSWFNEPSSFKNEIRKSFITHHMIKMS